jgi:hypothetical protein
MNELAREHEEDRVAVSAVDPMDAISGVVGSPVYSAHHRFPGLRLGLHRAMSVTSHALSVSRFYFGVEPKVIVDVVAHPERYRTEIAAKRAFFAEQGWRYVLVADDMDEDEVRRQLTPARAVAPGRPPRTTAARRPRTRRA